MLIAALVLLSALLFTLLAQPAQAVPITPSSASALGSLYHDELSPNITGGTLQARGEEATPYFPAEIPSCQACQPEWPSISSCATAAPAFSNWMYMIYNPASFVAVIKCGCADTFQSAYPQCLSCFIETNQCEEFLGVPSESGTSSILDGLRNVCGLGFALIGGVASSQSAAGLTYMHTITPTATVPTAISSTATSAGVRGVSIYHGLISAMIVVVSLIV